MKKINMLVAMLDYEDELTRLSELAAEAAAEAEDWYTLSFKYENECDLLEKLRIDESIDETVFGDDIRKNPKDRKSKCRLRRRATIFHKRKLQKTANIIIANYYKRSEEDMHFAKRRIDGEVVFSKSLTFKSSYILKRAEKIKKPDWKPKVISTHDDTADSVTTDSSVA